MHSNHLPSFIIIVLVDISPVSKLSCLEAQTSDFLVKAEQINPGSFLFYLQLNFYTSCSWTLIAVTSKEVLKND